MVNVLKKFIISIICMLLILTTLNLYSYSEQPNLDNELLIKKYCPGVGSTDGKHHFFRSYGNYILKLKDSGGNKLGSMTCIPCNCKYCNAYIWVSVELDKYVAGSNIRKEKIDECWAYAEDVHPVSDDGMVFFK